MRPEHKEVYEGLYAKVPMGELLFASSILSDIWEIAESQEIRDHIKDVKELISIYAMAVVEQQKPKIKKGYMSVKI